MRSLLVERRSFSGCLALAVLLGWTAPANPQVAQEVGRGSTSALRVFLECLTSGCDVDHFKREITFVAWVREPQDAQVHVIVTSEPAGGGRRYVMDFMGRESLEGLSDHYTHTSSVTDVQDEVRNALTQTLRLGLVRYTALAGLGDDLEVRATPVPGTPSSTAPSAAEDPWDFWVFGFSVSGFGQHEDQTSNRSFAFGVSANRTTEAWKLDFGGSGSFMRSEFRLNDSTVFVDNRDNWNVFGTAVRSLGDHWGAGAELEGSNSVTLNRDLLVGLGAGVEWDYFSYAESTRRSLLARYVFDVEHVEYDQTTIFGEKVDLVVHQVASVGYDAREPGGVRAWGSTSTRSSAKPGSTRSTSRAP